MTTRTMQFFSREQEFVDLLNELIKEYNLFVLYHYRSKDATIELVQTPLTVNFLRNRKTWDIYLSSYKPDMSLIDPNVVTPGRAGWLTIFFPREENNTLYLGDIGFKSEESYMTENGKSAFQSCLDLHKKLTGKIKKISHAGIYLCDVNYTRSRYIKDIWYTEEAKLYSKESNELRQPGVSNTRFLCEPFKKE